MRTNVPQAQAAPTLAGRVSRSLARWLRPAGVKSGGGPLVAIEGLGQPSWAPRDYGAFAREGMMQNAVLYRAVRMVSEAAASVPLLLYAGEEEVTAHPLLDLMDRPGPGLTGTDLLESFYGHLLVSGNAYVEAAAIDGEIRGLHLLRPDRVRVVSGGDGWAEAYDYTVGGRTLRLGGEAVAGVAAILHHRLFHPLDDHYGLSPIEPAAAAIDIHNTASRWNKALLDNSARPSGALVYSNGGELSVEQFERLKRELADSFQGARNAGRPLLLEGGLDWKAMSLSPRDLDFIESKNAAAREIALAIGVPPMLLGIPGDNTFSNYQEANRSFWRQTVLPLVNRTSRALSRWLTPAWDERLELRPDLDDVPALAGEREALWARIDKATFLSRREKRAAVGYGDQDGATSSREAGEDATGPFDGKFNPYHDERGRFTFKPDGDADIDTIIAEVDPEAIAADGDVADGEVDDEEGGSDDAELIPVARRPTPPRPGVGHNRAPVDPPRPSISRPTSEPFDGRAQTEAYRNIYGMPPAGSENDNHTVAYGEVDGQPVVGVNSTAPGYTELDRSAADAMRDLLITKHPDVMNTENAGWIPNNALYHAEATALLRAARANGGTIAGRIIEVQVDRSLCWSCREVLPKLNLELGGALIRFQDGAGNIKILRGGRWSK